MVLVNTCEDLVMADDVVTLSNPPVTPIGEEKLEETLFDVNVSEQSQDKKTIQKSGVHSS